MLGSGSALRLAIEQDRPPSMILFGPPGTGKTTIARIVAERTGAAFEEISAVSARVDDVRGIIAAARERLGANALRTILFIDEIHRFNKAQQDSVLHAVEDGLVTLIGATTENPYFEVNSALLSRCTVIELQALSEEDIVAIVERGAFALETEIAPERRDGDRRTCRRRRARGAPDPRARARNRTHRAGSARGEPRPRRLAQAPALVRPQGRPALRLRIGLHQVDARRRCRRVRVLPRGDARGGRGRTFHCQAHGHPRLRGRRKRRPERARSRRRSRPSARARRFAGGPAQPRPGGDLPRTRPEVERVRRRDLGSATRCARARKRATAGDAALHRAQGRRPRRAATARATSIRTTTPTGSRSRTFRKSSRDVVTIARAVDGEEHADDDDR